MLKEIFHNSLKIAEFTRCCTENYSSLTGWQELFFSYKSGLELGGGLLAKYQYILIFGKWI